MPHYVKYDLQKCSDPSTNNFFTKAFEICSYDTRVQEIRKELKDGISATGVTQAIFNYLNNTFNNKTNGNFKVHLTNNGIVSQISLERDNNDIGYFKPTQSNNNSTDISKKNFLDLLDNARTPSIAEELKARQSNKESGIENSILTDIQKNKILHYLTEFNLNFDYIYNPPTKIEEISKIPSTNNLDYFDIVIKDGIVEISKPSYHTFGGEIISYTLSTVSINKFGEETKTLEVVMKDNNEKELGKLLTQIPYESSSQAKEKSFTEEKFFESVINYATKITQSEQFPKSIPKQTSASRSIDLKRIPKEFFLNLDFESFQTQLLKNHPNNYFDDSKFMPNDRSFRDFLKKQAIISESNSGQMNKEIFESYQNQVKAEIEAKNTLDKLTDIYLTLSENPGVAPEDKDPMKLKERRDKAIDSVSSAMKSEFLSKDQKSEIISKFEPLLLKHFKEDLINNKSNIVNKLKEIVASKDITIPGSFKSFVSSLDKIHFQYEGVNNVSLGDVNKASSETIKTRNSNKQEEATKAYISFTKIPKDPHNQQKAQQDIVKEAIVKEAFLKRFTNDTKNTINVSGYGSFPPESESYNFTKMITANADGNEVRRTLNELTLKNFDEIEEKYFKELLFYEVKTNLSKYQDIFDPNLNITDNLKKNIQDRFPDEYDKLELLYKVQMRDKISNSEEKKFDHITKLLTLQETEDLRNEVKKISKELQKKRGRWGFLKAIPGVNWKTESIKHVNEYMGTLDENHHLREAWVKLGHKVKDKTR